MGTPVRITEEPDGRLCLESPYDTLLVSTLKAAIDYGLREWDPARKRWLISALAEASLLACLTRLGCQIVDARSGSIAVADDPYALMPDELREAFAQLYLHHTAPLLVAEASYRALARVFHPDNRDYGDRATMEEINDAIRTVRKYLNETVE